MYEQTQGAQQNPGAGQQRSGAGSQNKNSGSDDDVVDADYKEV